jgi:hypothetical protein
MKRDNHPQFNFGDKEPDPKTDTDAYARSSDPKPSHEAAERVSATALESEVYKTLRHDMLMTSLDVSRITGIPIWSISPRFKPLERKGLIERVGTMVVLNSNGRPRKLTAWRVKQ